MRHGNEQLMYAPANNRQPGLTGTRARTLDLDLAPAFALTASAGKEFLPCPGTRFSRRSARAASARSSGPGTDSCNATSGPLHPLEAVRVGVEVSRALARKPAERWGTATEMECALRAFLSAA